MTHLVVLFNDANALVDKLHELNLAQGTHIDLLYIAPNRPSRMKRWVSRNGWQRLALERARKLTVDTNQHIAAKGATYELHAVVGDELQFAQEMTRNNNGRLIDARAARFELPNFGAAAQATVEASAKFTAAVASSMAPNIALQPAAATVQHAPKIVYKSSLKRNYSMG